MSDCVALCRTRAKAQVRKVVFPEIGEARIDAACDMLAAEGLCRPVSVAADVTEAQIAAVVQVRRCPEAVARRMLSRPLIRAAAMVGAGEADALVAGVSSPTRRVIEAAGLGVGLSKGVTLPSSFFLMSFPDGQELIFADCGLNVSPDAEALAAIAKASSRSAAALLGEARVALLSFSTGASGAGDSVDVVRDAAKISGFDGPVQADAALNPKIAARKGAGAGNANVLVFPSLDAGNIAYKLCQELGGAQALGPILQGFRKPVCDLSRGASVEDIVAATAVTLALG